MSLDWIKKNNETPDQKNVSRPDYAPSSSLEKVVEKDYSHLEDEKQFTEKISTDLLLTKESINDKVNDKRYEKYAVYADSAATASFSLAALNCNTSPYQYFLGLGALVSGFSAVMGSPKSEAETVQIMRKFQPVFGTIALFLSAGYYFIGDNKMGTTMAGLAGACYSSTLAYLFRAKKKTDLPQERGWVGILGEADKNEN